MPDGPSPPLPVGPSLHPRLRWRRWLYLLRHLRHEAARDQLRTQVGVAMRRRLARSGPAAPDGARPSPLPGSAAGWLGSGDLVLESQADLLSRIRSALADGAAPVIAYRADPARLATVACHPVETVWLLEQRGYRVLLLTPQGLRARPAGWHAGGDAPWLLAVPPERQARLAQVLELRP